MSELEFFRGSTSLALAAIVAAGHAVAPPGADLTLVFEAATALERAGPHDLAVFTDATDPEDLTTTRAGACFVAARDVDKVPPQTIALVSARPMEAFRQAAAILHPQSDRPGPLFGRQGIDPAAIIHIEANLEPGVVVDPGVVIGPRVEIGAGTTIGANSVIGPGVRIGRGCSIDSHVSIRTALIGDRVIIHTGVRIGLGGPGFNPGVHGHAPRLGRVIIQDDVEIGANAAIERGGLRDTMIGEGTRIGVLVLVPTETTIGRHQRIDHGSLDGSSFS
jgi:UDP-3-O-[3-hydroxymyristoyl] glucosamine N-acyltransferase